MKERIIVMQYYKFYFKDNECTIELPDDTTPEQIAKLFKEWREMSAFWNSTKTNICYI